MNKNVTPILTATRVTVAFEGDALLQNVTFSLDEGENLAVIGPNGAGKSTLIRALLNMVPYDGTVTWAPETRIGYVPQKIDADRHLPINFRNLLYAKAAVGNLAATEIEKTITAVGLAPRLLETPVGHLSGGEFQRALIAFALLGLSGRQKAPAVLILDEPTASIDKPGEEKIYELVHRLQDDMNMTVIFVSHDLNFVSRYATKVLCLNRSVVAFGDPDEALKPEALTKLYGSPTSHAHHMKQ